jgi:tetratricopeptide (TPR) repeat protein
VDFFVSHVADDVNWAEWVAWELEKAGYTSILQKWDFAPGANSVLEIHRAVEQSRYIIAILSANYFQTLDVQTEWAAAFRRAEGDRPILIPLRVEECEASGLLAPLTTIDLVGLDEDQARAKLLDNLQVMHVGRAKPLAAPSFPARRGGLKRGPAYPSSSSPRIWNVPYRRNNKFVGRESSLERIAAALDDGQIAAASQAVAGLGGVGKTQLAVEYAYRHQDKYDVVWWIRAEKQATLISDYAALGTALSLPECIDPDQVIVLTAVRRWLETNESWLLVFDNAEDPDGALGQRWPFETAKDLLPTIGSGHVLITTRDTRWEDVAFLTSIDVFDMPESLHFLETHTEGSFDPDIASQLADALGRLPLALGQASAYIRQSGISFANYLERLNSTPQRILSTPSDYRVTVATTWQLSIEHVRSSAPSAESVLQTCAFLAPENIPVSLLEGEASRGAPLWDQADLEAAIMSLRRYSLLKSDGQSITVHRLLQEVVRASLPTSAESRMASHATELVNAAFPERSGDLLHGDECDWLLSHALTATAYSLKLEAVPAATSQLLVRVGAYLQVRARYTEAKTCFEQALKLLDSHDADSAGMLPKVLTGLGWILRDLGQPKGARTCLERAVSIYQASDPDNGGLARTLTGLGLVLRDLGELGTARAALERALEVSEKVGPSSVETADILDVFGRVMRTNGDLNKARAYLERALSIREAIHGSRDPGVGLTLMILGRVLGDLGELDLALSDLERALRILENSYGKDHPEVGRTLTFLGNLLRTLGRYEEARVHLERALAIKESIYIPHHPEITITSSAVGRIFGDLGRLHEARDCLERSLAEKEAFHGPDHLEVAITLAFLAGVLQKLGNLSEARDCYERALSINETTYGPDHPEVGIVLSGLGLVRRDLGDLAEAREYLERALTILETRCGPRHPDVGTTLSIYGRVLRTLGDLSLARAHLERALNIREAAYGSDHPLVSETLTNLGRVVGELGDLPSARSLQERALRIRESATNGLADHPETIRILTDLGRVLRRQGDLDGSRAYLQRALAMAESLYDSGHPTIGIVHSALGDLLSDMGNYALARQHLEKALGIKIAFYGERHLEVGITLSVVGNLLYRMGHLQQARARLERALQIDEANYGPMHPEVATVLLRLGMVLRGLGDIDSARTCFQRALTVATETLGEDHANVANIKRELSELA